MPTPAQLQHILGIQGAPFDNLTRDLKYVAMTTERTYTVQTARGVPGRYALVFDFVNNVVVVTSNPRTGPESSPEVLILTMAYVETLGMFLPIAS